MIKRLEWNKRTALGFVVAALTIVLMVALTPREMRIAESKMLEPVAWTFRRPSQSTIINNTLESAYSHDGLQATFHVWLSQYIEGVSDQPDHLFVRLKIDGTTTNINGYVEKVNMLANKDQASTVDWLETELYFENLSLVALVHGYLKDKQCYIELAGVNHAHSIHARAEIKWVFLTPNTQTHQLEVVFEITYYNGTAYNKVVQPFQLNITGRET